MAPTATDPNHTARDELARVVAWRFSQLSRYGFESDDASVLAARTEIDLHKALRLVQHGCPPKTAVRILV